MTDKGKYSATPKLTALELKGFAEGVQRLAEHIEAGQADDATAEQVTAAASASQALLRNAPIARFALRRLEAYAQEFVDKREGRQAELMISIFGHDNA